MNLHKILAIALFSCFAQASLQAGVITFSNEEIEAKDPNSTVIDEQTGNVTMKFKHDSCTRKRMLAHNEEMHSNLTFGSAMAFMPAATLSLLLLSPDVRPEIAQSKFPLIVHTITILCGASMIYNCIKDQLNKKAMIVLPKNERVVVGKVEKR